MRADFSVIPYTLCQLPFVLLLMDVPNAQALAAKDAVFISGHKFLGGAGTTGLLVCKKRLFCSKTPVVPGGGTVLFVSRNAHTYLRLGKNKKYKTINSSLNMRTTQSISLCERCCMNT